MLRKIILVVIIILAICSSAGTAFAASAPPGSLAPSLDLEDDFAHQQANSLATVMTVLMGAVFITAVVFLALRNKIKLPVDLKYAWLLLLLLIAAAAAIRIVAAINHPGYEFDVGCFKSWAYKVYEQGPSYFYTSDAASELPQGYMNVTPNYPPGYVYILWVLGFLRNVLSLDLSNTLFTLIVKMPSIIAEVVTAVIIYRIGVKQSGKTFGLLACAMVLFNPAMFFNSSVWGQAEAVFVLFCVLAVVYLKKENYPLGAFFYALSILIKPQAIFLAPLVGLAFFYAFFKKGNALKALGNMFAGAAIFSGVIFAASLPFRGEQKLFWIIDEYVQSVNTFSKSSMNACNLYTLVGQNFQDASLPFLFGMSFQTWGIIFIALICIVIIVLQWRSRLQRPFFDLSAFLIISIFMLAHSMHERYIVPVCIFLLFSYVYTRDYKTLLFASMFTATALLNQIWVLYLWIPWLPTFISALNAAVFLVYAFITIRKYASNKILIRTPALHGRL